MSNIILGTKQYKIHNEVNITYTTHTYIHIQHTHMNIYSEMKNFPTLYEIQWKQNFHLVLDDISYVCVCLFILFSEREKNNVSIESWKKEICCNKWCTFCVASFEFPFGFFFYRHFVYTNFESKIRVCGCM